LCEFSDKELELIGREPVMHWVDKVTGNLDNGQGNVSGQSNSLNALCVGEVDNSGTNPAEHWMLNLLADVYINLTLAEQPDDGCAGGRGGPRRTIIDLCILIFGFGQYHGNGCTSKEFLANAEQG
jgi:hypothetical protein